MLDQDDTTAVAGGEPKSGLVAAGLNLIFPGAGHWYCDEIGLGVVAFVFTVALAALTSGVVAFGLLGLLVIDGLLCADRYNRRLLEAQRPPASAPRTSRADDDSTGPFQLPDLL